MIFTRKISYAVIFLDRNQVFTYNICEVIIDEFNIYVDRLRGGRSEEVETSISPDFLEVDEKDLSFRKPVDLVGEAYVTDSDLILHLEVSTVAQVPCSICNEPVEVKVENIKFYHVESLEEIRSGIFNFNKVLREAILLEVPSFAECHEGNCPQRKVLNKFLKEQHEEEETYRPFADLDIEE